MTNHEAKEPPTCPECGAAPNPYYQNDNDKATFLCGTSLHTSPDGTVKWHYPHDRCRIASLTRQLAERDAELKALKQSHEGYKKLYDHALKCVDDAFQEYTGHDAILPRFLKLGEDKFRGVIKLAEAYREQCDRIERLERVADAARRAYFAHMWSSGQDDTLIAMYDALVALESKGST